MNGHDTDVNKSVAQFATLICLSLFKNILYIYLPQIYELYLGNDHLT